MWDSGLVSLLSVTMSRRSQRNASRRANYRDSWSSDERENSLIVASNIKVLEGGSSSLTGTTFTTATDDPLEEDTPLQ